MKIDSTFVGDLDAGRTADRAIVRAVIDLAKACGLRTIAEGVESRAQHELLASLGRDAIQGWLVAAAMPADDLDRWRQEHGQRRTRIGSTIAGR
ncbi:MAG: EAL domain-containing protein [Nitriliruptoraceae bacterium]